MPTLEAVKFENKPASDVLRARFFVGIKSDIKYKFTSLVDAEWKDRTRGRFDAANSLYPQSSFSGEISTIRPWSYMRVRLFPRGDGSEQS